MLSGLVTVVVPIYNKENYLEKALRSILKQTYRSLEILLIDDGSTDSSSVICREMEALDCRILYRYKDNAGVSSARNLGIELSRGEYVTFVDADDSICEMHIEHLVDALLRNNCDAAALSNFAIRQRKSFDYCDSIASGSRALRELMLLRFPTSTSAYLYRRTTIGDTRLREDIHFFEDFLFNYEVLTKCQSVALVTEITYIYNLNETSINTASLNTKRFSCLKIRHYLEEGRNSKTTLPPQFAFFEAHCVVSLLLAGVKTTSIDPSSRIMLRQSAGEIVSRTLSSLFTPFSYKSLVLLCSVSPKLAIFACRFYIGGKSTIKHLLHY